MSIKRNLLSGITLVSMLAAIAACSSDTTNGGQDAGATGGSGGETDGGGGSQTDSGAGGNSGSGGDGSGGAATGGSDAGTTDAAADAMTMDSSADAMTSDATTSDARVDGAVEGGAAGAAVVRFCHDIVFGSEQAGFEDVTFAVEVYEPGDGGAVSHVETITGQCDPADGEACQEIPVGEGLFVDLIDVDAGDVVLDAIEIDVSPGEQWILTAVLGSAGPELAGGTLGDGGSCASITFDDVYPPVASSIVSTGSGYRRR